MDRARVGRFSPQGEYSDDIKQPSPNDSVSTLLSPLSALGAIPAPELRARLAKTRTGGVPSMISGAPATSTTSSSTMADLTVSLRYPVLSGAHIGGARATVQAAWYDQRLMPVQVFHLRVHLHRQRRIYPTGKFMRHSALPIRVVPEGPITTHPAQGYAPFPWRRSELSLAYGDAVQSVQLNAP